MTDENMAEPAEILEAQIMSHFVPKNEREWWAQREITDLRAQLAALIATLTSTAAIIEAEGYKPIAAKLREIAADTPEGARRLLDVVQAAKNYDNGTGTIMQIRGALTRLQQAEVKEPKLCVTHNPIYDEVYVYSGEVRAGYWCSECGKFLGTETDLACQPDEESRA